MSKSKDSVSAMIMRQILELNMIVGFPHVDAFSSHIAHQQIIVGLVMFVNHNFFLFIFYYCTVILNLATVFTREFLLADSPNMKV